MNNKKPSLALFIGIGGAMGALFSNIALGIAIGAVLHLLTRKN